MDHFSSKNHKKMQFVTLSTINGLLLEFSGKTRRVVPSGQLYGSYLAHFWGDWSQSQNFSDIKPTLIWLLITKKLTLVILTTTQDNDKMTKILQQDDNKNYRLRRLPTEAHSIFRIGKVMVNRHKVIEIKHFTKL